MTQRDKNNNFLNPTYTQYEIDRYKECIFLITKLSVRVRLCYVYSYTFRTKPNYLQALATARILVFLYYYSIRGLRCFFSALAPLSEPRSSSRISVIANCEMTAQLFRSRKTDVPVASAKLGSSFSRVYRKLNCVLMTSRRARCLWYIYESYVPSGRNVRAHASYVHTYVHRAVNRARGF